MQASTSQAIRSAEAAATPLDEPDLPPPPRRANVSLIAHKPIVGHTDDREPSPAAQAVGQPAAQAVGQPAAQAAGTSCRQVFRAVLAEAARLGTASSLMGIGLGVLAALGLEPLVPASGHLLAVIAAQY